MAAQSYPDNHYIGPEQLTTGLYVHLDLGWMEHPFTFSHFRVKTQDQIETIRKLGLKRIRIDPNKCDASPLAPAPQAEADTPDNAGPDEETLAHIQHKQELIQELQEKRKAISKCEKQYMNAAKTVSNLNKNLIARPKETVAETMELIGQLADSLLSEKEVAMHLMNDNTGSEDVYYHSLNVSVLSMMLGREMNLQPVEIKLLGIGGIFHDIGKMKIPHKVLIKADNPTRAEADFLQQHCNYGVEIGQKVGLPDIVVTMIAQHHEAADGSGYPKRLKGDAIHPLTRVLSIVNTYDNLCNPVSIMNAMTPHEALSLMFSQQRARYDAKALGIFIKCLGVYPPGTLVKLNNDAFGMVMSVNPAKPLKPGVLVYDPDVPRDEAITLDLSSEPELAITKAMRPSQLPGPVFDYLSPRERISYYFDAASPSQAATA